MAADTREFCRFQSPQDPCSLSLSISLASNGSANKYADLGLRGVQVRGGGCGPNPLETKNMQECTAQTQEHMVLVHHAHNETFAAQTIEQKDRVSIESMWLLAILAPQPPPPNTTTNDFGQLGGHTTMHWKPAALPGSQPACREPCLPLGLPTRP